MSVSAVNSRPVLCLLAGSLAAGLALAAPQDAPPTRSLLPAGLRLSWNGTFQLEGTQEFRVPGRLARQRPGNGWLDACVADDGHLALMGDPDAGLPTPLLVLDPDGKAIWSGIAPSLQDAAFSADGACFSFRDRQGTHIVDLATGVGQLLPASSLHAAAGGGWALLAQKDGVGIWRNGACQGLAQAGLATPRALALDPAQGVGAAADARRLVVFDLADGRLRFASAAPAGRKWRDLLLEDGLVLGASQARPAGRSEGWLSVLDLQGRLLRDTLAAARELPVGHWRNAEAARERTERTCWPFSPFDSMRTVWNGYEQHMGDGSSTWSYLHQGLDLITPVAEPVFAVDSGFVKCVLTLGGSAYWRTAISAEQTADTSVAWLYAHLDPASIVFAEGDTVAAHDFLGEIVWWAGDWGHIHFVEIRDHGLVWEYADDEWGITGNPLTRLDPLPDDTPPVFQEVLDGRRFAFCRNGTDVYLEPDALSGDVDVVVNVVDQVGPSEWLQPPHSVHWWLRDLARDSLVVAPRLAHVLDHAYPFYASNSFVPWATVLYRRDGTLFPGTWMDPQRRYDLVLTNSDGDSLLEESDEALALSTAAWPDGPYRLVAEAADAAGNLARDSLEVVFHNGLAVNDPAGRRPGTLRLEARPNPFNPSTLLGLELARAETVELRLYDLAGRLVREWRPGRLAAGLHELPVSGVGLASGLYLCHAQAGGAGATLRLLLLR